MNCFLIYLLVPINVMRIAAAFTFTIDTRFWVNIARAPLAAACEFAWCSRCIATSAASSLLRIVDIGSWCRCLCRDHIRWWDWRWWLTSKRCGDLNWPLEIRAHRVLSLKNCHLKDKNFKLSSQSRSFLHCCLHSQASWRLLAAFFSTWFCCHCPCTSQNKLLELRMRKSFEPSSATWLA